MTATCEVRMADEQKLPPVKVSISDAGFFVCASCASPACKHVLIITQVRTAVPALRVK